MPSVKFVAERLTAREGIAASSRYAADLLLIRLILIGAEDEVALMRLRTKTPATKLIVYAGPAASDERIVRMMRIGVDGFVGRNNQIRDFLKAIRSVLRGASFFPRDSTHLLARVATQGTRIAKSDCAFSPREREIVKLIADGHTSKEIADVLRISAATVDTHRRNLMAKAGARNAADLIRYGRQHELLS